MHTSSSSCKKKIDGVFSVFFGQAIAVAQGTAGLVYQILMVVFCAENTSTSIANLGAEGYLRDDEVQF